MRALAAVLCAVLLAACGREPAPAAAVSTTAPGATAPDLVGDATCQGCHAELAGNAAASPHAAAKVTCETCHGPASQHVAWTSLPPAKRAKDVHRGFAFTPAGSRSTDWRFAGNAAVAVRARALRDRSELETCGRCHASGERIADDVPPGEALEQGIAVALIDEGLHHADGQPSGDPHVHTAFVQGSMHEAGVTCSDCHDAHTTALVAEGNALCNACHLAARYDVAEHHRHAGAEATRCVACHAVERSIDGKARIDHAFRVPRPDLGVALGVPDACTHCHKDRDAAWAVAAVKKQHPDSRAGEPHYATALHAGRTGLGDPGEALSIVARDVQQPAIVRASALALLARYPDPRDAALVVDAARDASPQVRRAAAAHIASLPPDSAGRVADTLLADPIRSVRYAALAAAQKRPTGDLTDARRTLIDAVSAERK